MKREQMGADELLGLIGSKQFATLSAAEQEMVLAQMPAQEYDELHEAYTAGQACFAAGGEPELPAGVKRKLDRAFLQVHPKKVPLFARPVVLWKAAAVFLLLFGTSFVCLKNKLVETKEVALLVRDTIFVQQPVALIKRMTDTVIEYRDAVVTKEKKRAIGQLAMAAHHVVRQDSNITRESGAEGIGIRTLQAGDLSKELNSNSGRSMKEDELLRQFSFTKI